MKLTRSRQVLRGTLALGVALGVATAMTACNRDSGGSGGDSTAKTLKIAFVTKPLDNVYFGSMVEGAQDEAKKIGAKLTTSAAQNVSDDSGQATKASALVSAGYDCYIVNPTSPTNLIAPLAQAKDATVVNVDLVMDKEKAAAQGVTVSTYVGTVNEDAGKAAGEQLLKLVPEGSKVAVVGALASDAGSLARIKGFKEAVQGKLEIVQTISADADRAKAKNGAAAILRAHSDIKGFFTVAGTQALGIQEAVDQEGRSGEVQVIGIDGTKEELQAISEGKLAAAIEQFPYLMGSQAVQACQAAAQGKTLPASVDTPVLAVTKDNAKAALDASPQPPEGFEVPNPFEG
ncbi:LacI family transcriptional regulator [Luteimicrobium album]|uniref:LacI family transcriptional regulator n=1 Tax=Luteimicrobium album TaxID=1054550 RepID=A0ABQ6I040_9MICO|nr:substrate-binding domain-containing protein [Luteimicrobium album]GMA23324.1 LacI family transcriptional regulator [Luteimicrobium album]